jgi:hypothetical protein
MRLSTARRGLPLPPAQRPALRSGRPRRAEAAAAAAGGAGRRQGRPSRSGLGWPGGGTMRPATSAARAPSSAHGATRHCGRWARLSRERAICVQQSSDGRQIRTRGRGMLVGHVGGGGGCSIGAWALLITWFSVALFRVARAHTLKPRKLPLR